MARPRPDLGHLFEGAVDVDLALDHPDFVIERVLQSGNSEALRWLTGEFTESALGEWLDRRGRRRLDRRTRRFWRWLLEVDAKPAAAEAFREDLWPH